MTEKRIDFHGRLDGRTPLGDGSVRFQARLTRVGVFDYGDHKELRTEDEVFAQKALDSFKGVVVTDGHAAWITPDNWKTYAKGHVGDDVRRDGDFVVASVIVKDAAMLKTIDARAARGESTELSMGYSVELDRTPGRTDAGEEYDAIQRSIAGNHAALGPSNWGRAGSSVRLLDGAAYARDTMAEQRIDAPTNDDTLRNDLASARSDNDSLRKERDQARTDAADAKKKLDDAEKKNATLEAERDQAKADAVEAAKKLDEQKAGEDARVDARITLIAAARPVLGEKYDFKGKTARQIHEDTLKAIDPKRVLDGKSDAYVEAAFDLAVVAVKKDRASLAATNEATETPAPPTKSVLDAALEKAEAEAKELAKAGPPACASAVRK